MSSIASLVEAEEKSLSSTMLNWALMYLEKGYSVIPINPNIKVPADGWKRYQTELPYETQVRQWWAENPNYDVGTVTGPITNRLVVDFDGPKGIEDSKKFEFPETLRVGTRNGFQAHYLWDIRLEACKTTLVKPFDDMAGTDFRGRGGYTKLVPSQYSDKSGRYYFLNSIDTPLVPCPEWLVKKLLDRKDLETLQRRESGESWLKEKLDGIKPGNRNSTFTSIAGSFRSRGYSSGDIFGILSPLAAQHGVELAELQTICTSVGQYTPKLQVNLGTTEAQNVSDFLMDEQAVDWIVPGIIAKRSIGFIAGLQETSKTWIAMDLAIEAARGGGYWLGKFPIKAAKCLFVDQERFKGETQRRLKAIIAEKGLKPEALSKSLIIQCGTSTRLNLQNSYEAFRKHLLEIGPDIVIVDSFTTFHTAAENDRTEIQKVLELVKQLRNEFGCTFLFINHEGKGVLNQDPENRRDPHSADMMGSIAVPAAAELVLTVRRKDVDSSVVYMTKNSLATKIEPFEVTVRDMNEEKTKIKVEGK